MVYYASTHKITKHKLVETTETEMDIFQKSVKDCVVLM